MEGATSRAIIIAYSMPIWATVLSRLLLRERLTRGAGWRSPLRRGLDDLVSPLVETGVPHSVLYSLGCAVSWAFATVYIKWMKVTVPPLANAAWQLLFGSFFLGVGAFVFDGYPRLWPIHTEALLAVLYIGFAGVGLAQFLWWAIVGRLPAITASIGALLVPVIGVAASTVFLGERPSAPDIVGFALIFAAASCVLLQPGMKHDGNAGVTGEAALCIRTHKKLCGSTSTANCTLPCGFGAFGQPFAQIARQIEVARRLSPAGASDGGRAPRRSALPRGRARAPARRAARARQRAAHKLPPRGARRRR